MHLPGIAIAFIVAATLVSCNRTAAYEQRGRTLDSLSGAINGLASSLQKQDTVQLQKYLKQFRYYSDFIGASRFDTLDKTAADHLQNFYHSGSALSAFPGNKKTVLARIALLNSQYKRLAEDIRNRAITVEQADEFVDQEKKEAARVLDIGQRQQQLFYRNLEQYRISVKQAEQIIRNYNNGQLPTIVNDTTLFF
jgi:hypothetical protein